MSISTPATDTARGFPLRKIMTITPLVLIGLGAAVVGALARVPDGQIALNIHIGSLDLGGKSFPEAKIALERWNAEQQEMVVHLRPAPETGLQHEWKPAAKKLGLSIDVAATLDAAGKAGHESLPGEVTRWVSGSKPILLAPMLTIDNEKIQSYLKLQIVHDVNRKPKRAKFVIMDGGGFGLNHEKPGLKVDIAASTTRISDAWKKFYALKAQPTPQVGTSTTAPVVPVSPPSTEDTQVDATNAQDETNDKEPRAELAIKTEKPDITAEDLKDIDGLIGKYASYVSGTSARANNIRLAASHINGTLLRPGQVFSYNDIVGPRDADAGYRNAPILIKGAHGEGIAGGICQTSGTLFNAVLRSGLKIVHRENHSAPIGYLPRGLDATVAYGSIDLKFENDTQSPVYLTATMDGRDLAFRLYGKTNSSRKVSLYQAGSYRRSNGGLSTTWYRVIREEGKVVHRDVIQSSYRPPAEH